MTGPHDEHIGQDTLAELLASDSVWDELADDHEDAVVAAVQQHGDRGTGGPPRDRLWRIATAVSAVVAVIASVVAVVVVTADPAVRTADERLALEPTSLAAGASATLEVTSVGSGTRLILFVHGLAPAAGDEVYEGWMLDGERVVSAGTFHLRGSDDPVWLWTGVSPDEFDRFVVTRHAIDDTTPPTSPDDVAVVLRTGLGGASGPD